MPITPDRAIVRRRIRRRFALIPLLLLLAAAPSPRVTIEVDCAGGIRPSQHRAVLDSDGAVSAVRLGFAAGHAAGHVDPDAVMRLSARLDAVGFDRLSSPKANHHVYDGVTCTILRTTPRGTHRIVLEPGSEVPGRRGAKIAEVRAVMDDAFRLAATIEPSPTR